MAIAKRMASLTWMLLLVATATAAAPQLPEYYGVYALTGKLVELKAVPVTTRVGLRAGGVADRGLAMDGFQGDPPLKLKGGTPTFIVYLKNVEPSQIRLSALAYRDSVQANELNIMNTAPQFFRNVYGISPYDRINMGLWQAEPPTGLRQAPVPNKPGMYKLVPAGPLSPARYALYFGEALHEKDVVFTASVGRRSAAYYFEVVR